MVINNSKLNIIYKAEELFVATEHNVNCATKATRNSSEI